MNRKECLDAAAEAVLKNRQAVYGPPENSFADTAVIWSVILGVTVKPWQVPLMLAGLKVVRAKDAPDHADNWADLAGYAACGAELAEMIGLTNEREELALQLLKLAQDGGLPERDRVAAFLELRKILGLNNETR